MQRYAERLSALAGRAIGRRLRQRIEPEDVIQSVFRTFFRRARKGEFDIDHCGELWRLLATITLNRVRKKGDREGAQRRDVRREVLTDPLLLDGLEGREPSPLDVTIAVDQFEQFMSELQPNEAVTVRGCLVGESVEDAAKAAGCSRWTVQRKRRHIIGLLRRRLDSADE